MSSNNDIKSIAKDLKNYLEFRAQMGLEGLPKTKSETQRPTVKEVRKKEQSQEQMEKKQMPVGEDIITIEEPAGLFDSEVMSLEEIREEIGDCTRCQLHEGRTNLVFGDGNPKAKLMFVGEGPGRDEDMQGKPFVGRSGKLLTKIIEAMGLKREDVYIGNVVKCRPPNNRTPEASEMDTCELFLFKQIRYIQPEVIVCLGATAAKSILKTKASLGSLRGKFHNYGGSKLMVTYHPAALLRNPHFKKPTWEDMQVVMKELGLKLPRTQN
ncbi:MAG: uracil-DNA glycosylase [Thermodesulfobacteriota bacterium]